VPGIACFARSAFAIRSESTSSLSSRPKSTSNGRSLVQLTAGRKRSPEPCGSDTILQPQAICRHKKLYKPTSKRRDQLCAYHTRLIGSEWLRNHSVNHRRRQQDT
jgi:hypothetical protein